jgi:type IV secretion system protein VirB3
MHDELPSHFYAPVHRSLTQPMLMLGIPQVGCTVLWTTVLGLVFGAGELWALPLGLVAHVLAAAMTKADPHFWPVFRSALWTPNRLEP